MFWNKKPKPLPVDEPEVKAQAETTKHGDYDKFQYCESCNWAANFPHTHKQVCPKCGESSIEIVTGRWQLIWVNCLYFGYFAPHKFERK